MSLMAAALFCCSALYADDVHKVVYKLQRANVRNLICVAYCNKNHNNALFQQRKINCPRLRSRQFKQICLQSSGKSLPPSSDRQHLSYDA